MSPRRCEDWRVPVHYTSTNLINACSSKCHHALSTSLFLFGRPNYVHLQRVMFPLLYNNRCMCLDDLVKALWVKYGVGKIKMKLVKC